MDSLALRLRLEGGWAGRRLRPGLIALSACALFLGIACAGGEVPTATLTESFEVGERPRVAVESQHGDIRVVGGPAGQVRVDAVLRDPDKVTYRVFQEGDTVRVEVRLAGISFGDVVAFNVDRSADLTITVPAATNLELETLSGAIELRGLEASGAVRTANGEIKLIESRGEFSVRTGNGGIEVAAFEGDLNLESDNGSVAILDVSGVFNAMIGNGRLTFRGELDLGSRNRLETRDGRISFVLIDPANLALDAKGENGNVDVDLPLTRSVDERRHVVGSLGTGETELVLRATDAAIEVIGR